MEEFKERMIVEYVELNERIGRLDNFIAENPIFEGFDGIKREIMRKQLIGMVQYRETLRERMKLEGITNDDIIRYDLCHEGLPF